MISYGQLPFKSLVLRNLLVSLIGLAIGSILFFLNPWLSDELWSESYVWFLDFSRTIFQPQSAYYAESILLPLIAKAIRATSSLFIYKLFCGFLTICILPVIAIFSLRFFQSIFKTLLFLVLFGLTFQYFKYYILGFPDPLTILLLVLAVFQMRWGGLFVFLTLAMLSHFSMAALGAIGLAGMYYFSPNALTDSTKKTALTIVAAIVSGKLLLLSWYSIFHYQLISRLDWALAKGYGFFLGRYEENILGFWLTPGISFLVIYFLICIYFLWQKKITFVLSAIFAVLIAYIALFWTVDGLRVFAVIIAAPYAYLLVCFINSLPCWRQAK